MNIHEYQAKALLKSYGAPVADGAAAMTPAEAEAAAKMLPGPLWVVKAQIHAGGRGKGKFKEAEAGEPERMKEFQDSLSFSAGALGDEQRKVEVKGTFNALAVQSLAGGDPAAERRLSALQSLARKDPRAAYDLGLRLFRGDGVRQDSYQALQWMRDAAERGDLEAQKAVGRLYLTGLEEMGSDPREAEKWLGIAAGRGDEEAKKLLAEARILKRSEFEYRRWVDHWRGVFYGYWYNGYPYRAYWRHGYWYFY